MNLTKEKLWKSAEKASETVDLADGNGLVYKIFLFYHCWRYLFRYMVLKLFKNLPVLFRFFLRRIIKKTLGETKMLAMMRDLGKNPRLESPLEILKTEKGLRYILDFIICDKDIESFLELSKIINEQLDKNYDIHFYLEKLKIVSRDLPEELLREGFYGKVVRSMIGVIGYCLYRDKNYSLKRAAQLGFWFGMLYLYDEATDIPYLVSEKDMIWIKQMVHDYINNNDQYKFSKPPNSIAHYLQKTFVELEKLCPRDQYPDFYVCLGALAYSQEAEFENKEKIYINQNEACTLLAMKAGMTRIIPATLAGWEISDDYLDYAMVTGIANQLIDDLRDFPEDYKNQIPTLYVKYKNGQIKQHPIFTYIKALNASSNHFAKNRWIIKFLWSIRMTHALRTLSIKSKKMGIFFPMSGSLGFYSIFFGKLDYVIFDLETLLSEGITSAVTYSKSL